MQIFSSQRRLYRQCERFRRRNYDQIWQLATVIACSSIATSNFESTVKKLRSIRTATNSQEGQCKRFRCHGPRNSDQIKCSSLREFSFSERNCVILTKSYFITNSVEKDWEFLIPVLLKVQLAYLDIDDIDEENYIFLRDSNTNKTTRYSLSTSVKKYKYSDNSIL